MGNTRVMLIIVSLATILSCFNLPSEAAYISRAVWGSDICSDHLFQVQSNRYHYVWSQGFPREYRSNTACTMTVAAPENHRMEIRFLQFLTETPEDVLFIYDGNSSDARLIGFFSGDQNSTRIRSSNNSLTLRFITDGSVQLPGFNISVRAVQLPGQRVASSPIFGPRNPVRQGSPILGPRNPVRQDLLDSVIRLKQKITDDYVNVSRELDQLMVSVAKQSPVVSRMSIGTIKSDMTGEEIQKGGAPFMLLLRSSNAYDENSVCSAFLVRTHWVITAAHCFRFNFSNVTLLGGVVDWNDGGGHLMYIPVENVFIHPNFNRLTLENDIALILLPTPFENHQGQDLFIEPIPVEPINQFPAGFGLTLGWGSANSTQSPPLVIFPLSIDEFGENCRRRYSFFNPDTMICVEGIEQMGVCIGDTGGPMGLDGVVVGVVSQRISCRATNVSYSIFTKISYFCEWMQSIQCKNDPTACRYPLLGNCLH